MQHKTKGWLIIKRGIKLGYNSKGLGKEKWERRMKDLIYWIKPEKDVGKRCRPKKM
jgi:hypothetical protein